MPLAAILVETESLPAGVRDLFTPVFGNHRGVPLVLSDAPHHERYPFGQGGLAERRLRFLYWMLEGYGYEDVSKSRLLEGAWKQRSDIGISASTKRRFWQDREADVYFLIGGGFARSIQRQAGFGKFRRFYQIREIEEWPERGIEAYECYIAEVSK